MQLSNPGRESANPRQNNFDFLRFVLACFVIVTHSFAVLTTALTEPLEAITRGQMNLGTLAVDCFFIISGFLITASWFRSRGLVDYLRKRILRIHPAFIVCCTLCVVLVGPVAEPNLHHYLRQVDWLGFLKNVVLLNRIQLPAVPGIDGPPEVNGSLWTIKIEFECYIFVALFGLTRLLSVPKALFALLAVVLPLGALTKYPDLVARLPLSDAVMHLRYHFRFLSFFLFGVLGYAYRDHIPHRRSLLLTACGLYAIGALTLTGPWLFPFAIAYALFYVAFHPRIRLEHFAAKRDLSYGIYLYGWPIQYLLSLRWAPGTLSPYLLAVMALPLAGLCALGSWTLVEAPSLRSIRRAAKVTLQEPPVASR